MRVARTAGFFSLNGYTEGIQHYAQAAQSTREQVRCFSALLTKITNHLGIFGKDSAFQAQTMKPSLEILEVGVGLMFLFCFILSKNV